jgi:long-chain fatty acid transport protein
VRRGSDSFQLVRSHRRRVGSAATSSCAQRWRTPAARLAALVGAATLLLPAAAHASPQDLFGFGARSSGLAMSGPASSEGYEGTFGGPALLAETREKTFTLGYVVGRFSLSADTPQGRVALPNDEMKQIYIGAALPLPLGGALTDRLTFGVGFYDPVNFLVRGKILYPERFQYPVLAPRTQSLALTLGLGMRLGDRVFVGVGYEALAAVIGEIDITLDSTGHVGARSDDQEVAAYAPIASVAVDLSEHLRAGLTFRGELIGRFQIVIKAQDLGVAIPDLNVAGLAQYDPAQLHAEVRWTSDARTLGTAPKPATQSGWTVMLGAIGRRWSQYPGGPEKTVVANDSPDYGPPKVNAHDTIAPRLAVERSFPLTPHAGGRLRAGYAYEPSPMPEQTGTSNYFDNDRHVITAGVGLAGDATIPIRLDAFLQLHVLPTRTHVKDERVTAADPNAPGAPWVKAGGHVFVAGITTGVSFRCAPRPCSGRRSRSPSRASRPPPRRAPSRPSASARAAPRWATRSPPTRPTSPRTTTTPRGSSGRSTC